MNKQISFLIGAGFSAPMGYPIGNKLNELLLNSESENFAFHTSGQLCVNQDGSKPDFGFKTSYDREYEFCMDLMRHFLNKNGYFDYEEFYDFIHSDISEDSEIVEITKRHMVGPGLDVRHMLNGTDNIMCQLIAYYLHDGNGRTYYDDEPYILGGEYPPYTGILRSIRSLSLDSVIHFHTLNHDLFLERFNNTDFFEGNLCDGFSELGSPYFGSLEFRNRKYMCRLSRYTGEYPTNLRLYKLHGSLNYGIYYAGGQGLLTRESYIKTRYGIGFGELYKEITNQEGVTKYENCWINYHADFLTGTSSKIERYSDPLLYGELFAHFKQNLANSDMLIIVGYGGKDSEINRIMEQDFDYRNRNVIIIDPYPGAKVMELQATLNAKLVAKQLNEVVINDL